MAQNTLNLLNEKGLEGLNELFIKVHKNEDLYSLIYDQINSPDTHPVAMECRGLVVKETTDGWKVISRGFDRFFNYGEKNTVENLKGKRLDFYAKRDGSLVRFYCHEGKWLIGSKSIAIAEVTKDWQTNEFHRFDEIVYSVLDIKDDDGFQSYMNRKGRILDGLSKDCTYIFELTGPKNRVVVKYPDSALTLLAVRDNATGVYKQDIIDYVDYFDVQVPLLANSTIEDAIKYVGSIKGFDEGLVGYEDNIPVVKLKNSNYVAAHHIQSSTNIPKQLTSIICKGEMEEFKAYFGNESSKYSKDIKVIEEAYNNITKNIDEFDDGLLIFSDAKEFALKVKDLPLSMIYFKAKKNKSSPYFEFHMLSSEERFKLIYNEFKRTKVIA